MARYDCFGTEPVSTLVVSPDRAKTPDLSEPKSAKKNHEAAMISNDALRRQVDELRQSAGSQPKVSTHRDRKLMRLFHPDNYTNAPAEVRTKMVEAYRLVSESRPDA